MVKTIVQLLDFIPDSQRSMEAFLLALAENLQKKGWRTIHVFAGEPSEAFRDALKELDSPYHCATFPLTLKEVKRLEVLLTPYQPEILQTHFLSKFSFALWHLKNVTNAKQLIICDQSSGTLSRSANFLLPLTWLRGRLSSLYISKVISVSDFVRQRNVYRAFIKPDLVQTIYNSVDINKFKTPDVKKTNTNFTIVFAGQLIPEKGVETLLRAVKQLEDKQSPPFSVFIAGQGKQGDYFKSLCTEQLGLKTVTFLGQVRDMPQLFASADVVVVPSEWEEAFGFVAAEAMACGTPVVASNAGALPEVLDKTGWVFPKGDVDALANLLFKLITNPALCPQMGCAARVRAQTHFALNGMVENYVSVVTSFC